ncbi:lipoprotein [Mycoplasma capricolum]|uniref:lipoprotein n=1 Tax=Mycoplasma capricolum TaxID=2095 RepID=UPI000631A6B4|nr:lipoprotein [Mycoplasma capricolum]KKW61345.1 Prolipoprotein [Mycoplasma capricolum subsp. capricolum]
MKKLLTLLGSVGLVASTSAIAVACENKIPAISLSTDKNGVKEKSDDQLEEKLSEKVGSAPQADQSIVDKSAKEVKKKEIDEAKEAVKKAEEKSKLAQEKYKDALKKGDRFKTETLDEIDVTQEEFEKALKDLEAAKKKLEELVLNR